MSESTNEECSAVQKSDCCNWYMFKEEFQSGGEILQRIKCCRCLKEIGKPTFIKTW